MLVAINTSTPMWLYLKTILAYFLGIVLVDYAMRTFVCGSLVPRLSCLRRPGFNFSFIIIGAGEEVNRQEVQEWPI